MHKETKTENVMAKTEILLENGLLELERGEVFSKKLVNFNHTIFNIKFQLYTITYYNNISIRVTVYYGK